MGVVKFRQPVWFVRQPRSKAAVCPRPAATYALTFRAACRRPAHRRRSKRTAVWTATAARPGRAGVAAGRLISSRLDQIQNYRRRRRSDVTRPLLLVRSDTLDRDERRACLRGDAVVSAEDGECIPDSRIASRRSNLAPTVRGSAAARPDRGQSSLLTRRSRARAKRLPRGWSAPFRRLQRA
jgi:hypothetical protein